MFWREEDLEATDEEDEPMGGGDDTRAGAGHGCGGDGMSRRDKAIRGQ